MSPDELLAEARKAAAKAYAPYSNLFVGAVVVTRDGRLFSGANVENASYGLSICAETNAITTAIAAGVREITECAVTAYFPQKDDAILATPCGRCRQVIAEFASDDFLLYAADYDMTQRLTLSMADLLPHPFRFL